ncbi:class I tRNA ligase family protein [endosymbiont GvMRE of Glomus versiforme]|uniref:class I tRNA ligase family protein n=1 Tax=endosymbiont GvMRE of Glomus versiforme TaxID=2039283 RepID=UPI000EE985FC|nr:class I tRNA ligase family protein [endosymbiont GvMRE of Glomus versiforme]RHZ35430.1 Valine--tRNA ligase [endosymbiont GvMRE of Glomus versiforme]
MFSTKYDFHLTEKNKKNDYWKKIASHIPNNFADTILLPPPNITGNLHLGHALDTVSPDFLVRFSILNKKSIYWIAGLDHAGISTQSKVEKLNLPELDTNEKKKEYTLQTWYPQNRKIFAQQWEKLGLLIDYERASFTLDPAIQKQVREAFIKLYWDGLIYRGTRLVNWDPQLKSVISDIEVEHKPATSKLYYLKYPLLTNIKKRKNQEENLPKVTRAVIQNEKGKILLVKDKKWGWNFPGGKIELNEKPAAANCREVKEETNLKVESLEKIVEEIVFYANQYWKTYFFYVKNYSGEIQIPKEEKEKILAVKFVDYNSLEVKEARGLYRSFFTNLDEYLKPLNSVKNDCLLVATSRPETIFADVALFVNPHDKRFKNYLGESVRHPFTGKIIPILADESIKMDFGSGVLKCTPGHDFIDYELGKKYQLPIISCCDEKGILNELAGQWQGQEISSIREEFVRELEKTGICVKIEEYETNLACSTKSGAVIEPLLSQQWFLDLPTLIKKIEQKNPNFLKEIEFIPNQFQKKIEDWKNKTREWCISRQLWWGHQIPAWYHKKTGEIYVGEELNKCFCVEGYKKNPNIKCMLHPCSLWEWEPEKDVLDTWFSSGLWPLIALAKEGEKFPSPPPNCYPITTLITGYDILFFWVLKMILLGTYFTGKVPFQKVLLHGLIRDKYGKKMSKSLGNGVEPEELIEKYGCDSLRLFLLENNIWGSDLIYEESKIIGCWRFCQKLWSIGNLITNKIPATELQKINKKDLNIKK